MSIDLLSLENVNVRHFEKTLFESFSFRVQEGEQWAILGESGAGKSALLHTLHGSFNITNGKVSYPIFDKIKKDRGVTDPLFTRRRLMAFVGQQARFKNKQNVQNFFYQQRFHSWFSEEADTVNDFLTKEWKSRNENSGLQSIKFPLDWIIEHLKLGSLLPKTLIQLSNGETRRLMLAQSLIGQPILLLLDNPFIGLDVETRSILDSLLAQIVEKDTYLIMATTPREIPDVVNHILYLKEGKVLYKGSKKLFLKRKKFQEEEIRWEPNVEILSSIDQLQSPPENDFVSVLRMRNIAVVYGGKYILKDINWTVKKGEKWALLGHNGAGKSTLLSLLNGDHPQAYANDIELFGHPRGSGESIWDLKKKVGFVSPEMHQYFRGNGWCVDVILSGLDDTMGFKKKNVTDEEKRLALLWLRLLDLAHLETVRFKDCPRGEQRLILLLRALIKNPPVLLLDEPCQGLDFTQRERFKRVIDKIWKGEDKTLIYVSHYREDIPSIVTQVLELKNGRIKA